MKMISNKLIKITPLGTFFFGSEKTFNNPQGEVSYFARSNQWPQQTGILGMLRYLMATYKGSFDWNLIGDKSFDAGCSNQNFGIISGISPVFLLEDKNYWIEAGRDYQEQKDEKPVKFTLESQSHKIAGKWGIYETEVKEKPLSLLSSSFDYKKRLGGCLVNLEKLIAGSVEKEINSSDFRWTHDIFKEQKQAGNNKNYDGGSDSESFFKQVSYKMISGFSFAVEAEFEFDENKYKGEELFQPRIASLGANQSKFKVEFIDIVKPCLAQSSVKEGKRVVLLSDALVDFDQLKCCDFVIGDSIDFRNIITTKTTKDWARMNPGFSKDKPDMPHKSKTKYNLLRRGSVLYFPNDIQAADLSFLANTSFEKIGYNHYYITK